MEIRLNLDDVAKEVYMPIRQRSCGLVKSVSGRI